MIISQGRNESFDVRTAPPRATPLCWFRRLGGLGVEPTHDIALSILHLHYTSLVNAGSLLLLLNLIPQLKGLFDTNDISEQRCVGNAQTLETVDVSRFVEVLVECASAHVHEVSADLAGKLHTQTVKAVQPEGNRLAVPGKREFERVVDSLLAIFVLAFAVLLHLLRCIVGIEDVLQLLRALSLSHTLLALHVDLGIATLGTHRAGQSLDPVFSVCYRALF
ncbi:hypothetical protein HG530_008656 [Fusarium avenaceum]|nr:hypothetical protein HG530_008656 [Fusarium avenaceum]